MVSQPSKFGGDPKKTCTLKFNTVSRLESKGEPDPEKNTMSIYFSIHGPLLASRLTLFSVMLQ